MTLPDDWTAGTVRTNGVDLGWYRTGEGPPLVLAHGCYDSGRRWVSLAEDLAEEYRDDHDLDPDAARRLAIASFGCAEHAVVELAREGYRSPVAEAFADVSCPTLVVRRDVDVDERVGDLAAAEDLRDGRPLHVPDAGHYVFHDAYDAALAELRTFLRRL